jgi:hypothetical protein
MVVEHARRWELANNVVDDRYGYRAVGTHRVTVFPPESDKRLCGPAGWMDVELTPGRDLPHALRELRLAISNMATDVRCGRI